MNPSIVVLAIAWPMVIAVAAVLVALACRRHPVTSAIITDDASLEALSNDMNTRHKLLVTIAIALVLTLFLSLSLYVMTHLELLGPLLALFQDWDADPLVVTLTTYIFASMTFSLSYALKLKPLHVALTALLILGIELAWLLVDSWLTFNLTATVIAILCTIVAQQGISFLRLSLILMLFAVLYDAWQVFGTGNMVVHAMNSMPNIGAAERQLVIPSMLLLPSNLALTPEAYGFIGVGDAVVFSLLAISAARLAKRVGSWAPVVLSFAGFAVSMMVSFSVGWYFNSPQPATIYIVPLCVLPVIVYAKWRGVAGQLTIPFYGAGILSRK